MIRTTIYEYYVLSALMRAGISMITAMYVTFLLSKGLNLFEVNVVNFTFFLTLFICEIPTGAFADVFGRKASVIVACLLYAASMLVYGISETLPGFITAEVIGGFASTFSSGAFRAWFVDKLRHHGYEGKLNHIFARAGIISQVVGIGGALLGAWLADYSMMLPWLVGAGFFLLTFVVALGIKEEYFVAEKFSFAQGFAHMKETVRASVRYGMGSSNVRFVLLLVIAQIFANQGPNMQWQPFFGESISGKTNLGFVWMAISLSMMAGAWISPYLLRTMQSERKVLVACQVVIGVGIIVAAVSHALPLTLLAFLIHEAARGGFGPIKEAYLHDNIPSKQRATIESFESLAHHGGGMIGLLLSGFLALKAGIPATWAISGMLLVLVTLLIAKNRKQKIVMAAPSCP